MEVNDEFWNAQTAMAKIQKKICFLLIIKYHREFL